MSLVNKDQFVLTDEERLLIETRRQQAAQAEVARIAAEQMPDVNAMTCAEILALPPETRQKLLQQNVERAYRRDQ